MVCLFCRRRKIRCDQSCPCSACLKHNVHCDLDDIKTSKAQKSEKKKDIPIGATLALTNGESLGSDNSYLELSILKERLASLEGAVQKNAARRRRDNLENLPELSLREYKINFHGPIKISRENTFSKSQIGPFRWIVLLSLDQTVFGLFKESAAKKYTQKPSKKPHDIALTLLGGTSAKVTRDDLLLSILQILPKPFSMWGLVDRFFTKVYPYIPVIDELVFKSRLSQIMGPLPPAEAPVTLTVNDHTDLAYIGMLLIILRLSYLSLFDNINRPCSTFQNDVRDAELLAQTNISDEFVTKAKVCLESYDLLHDNGLEIIQLLTLLRVYNNVNPEAFKQYDHNQTLASLHVSMALSSWINREPGNYPSDEEEQKRTTQSRKLWYALVFLDFVASVSLGSYPQIHPDSFNVELPAASPRVLNCLDLKMEQITRVYLHRMDKLRRLFTPALQLVGKVGGEFSIGEILLTIKAIEDHQCDTMEEISDFSTRPPLDEMEAFTRNTVLQAYLMCQYFLFCTYIHIYFTYERRNEHEHAGNVEVRLLRSIVKNILPLIPYKSGMKPDPFAGSTDLFSSFLLYQCIWPTSYMLLVFLAKYSSSKRCMDLNDMHEVRKSNDPRYCNLYDALGSYVQTLTDLINIFTSFFEASKPRYHLCEKLYFFQKNLVESIIGTRSKAPDDKSYVKVSTQFLVGCNEIIKSVTEKPEYAHLKRSHPSSPSPPPPPATPEYLADLSGKIGGFFDSQDNIDSVLDFLMLERLMQSS